MQPDRTDAAAPPAPDWSRTALGEPAHWPPCLRLTLDIMLNSPLASLLMWGRDQIMLFNDAYVSLLGATCWPVPGGKVPALQPAAWSWNAAALQAAWDGQPSVYRAQALPVWQDGAPGQQMLDLFYTPIRDARARVRGILCTLAAAAAPAAASRVLRILVVEDHADTRYLVCEMLKTFGHQAQPVADGEAAACMLAAQRFDILFTDVCLPGISGPELARLARRAQPGLQVIFASGFDQALARQIDFPARALQKPYDIEQLRTAIEQSGACLPPTV